MAGEQSQASSLLHAGSIVSWTGQPLQSIIARRCILLLDGDIVLNGHAEHAVHGSLQPRRGPNMHYVCFLPLVFSVPVASDHLAVRLGTCGASCCPECRKQVHLAQGAHTGAPHIWYRCTSGTQAKEEEGECASGTQARHHINWFHCSSDLMHSGNHKFEYLHSWYCRIAA